MSDLIKREDVVALWDKYHYEIATKAVEFDRALRQLPSAEPKWIPVTERLPKETGLYLVSLKTKGVGLFEETHPDGFVYVSAYDAVIMHWGYGDKNVQAWMPIPEPYQEADHD